MHLGSKQVWRCSWATVGHTFVLAVCRSEHLCSICSSIRSSRPQLQIGDGASFIFLNMWALSRLRPVHSLTITTCCHRSRKQSHHSQRAAPGPLWWGSSFLGRWHIRAHIPYEKNISCCVILQTYVYMWFSFLWENHAKCQILPCS